jgi:hypothetical protein
LGSDLGVGQYGHVVDPGHVVASGDGGLEVEEEVHRALSGFGPGVVKGLDGVFRGGDFKEHGVTRGNELGLEFGPGSGARDREISSGVDVGVDQNAVYIPIEGGGANVGGIPGGDNTVHGHSKLVRPRFRD